MRMMDRPMRPLFPEGFIDEVQIRYWVMSHDGQNDLRTSWPVVVPRRRRRISDAPFEGPIATVRVARISTDAGAEFVLNPSQAQIEFSDLDLVLSGHKDGINMIEVGAAEISEADLLEAMKFGIAEGITPILELIEELRGSATLREAHGRPGPAEDEVMEASRAPSTTSSWRRGSSRASRSGTTRSRN